MDKARRILLTSAGLVALVVGLSGCTHRLNEERFRSLDSRTVEIERRLREVERDLAQMQGRLQAEGRLGTPEAAAEDSPKQP